MPAVFSSHLAVLLAAVDQTTGDVLEVGGGEFSTPALHGAIEGDQDAIACERTLVTVEPNARWREKLLGYACAWHKIAASCPMAFVELLDWGVIFLDQEPRRERAPMLEALRDVVVDFVVVHDTEDLNAKAYGWGESLFGWTYTWHSPEKIIARVATPRTTVLSNVKPFDASGL